MSAVRFVAHGLVQGVGYRWFVWREAERLGLRGVVRNLPDGSVEVIAEGVTEALDRLERALSEGPTVARVDRVEKTDVPHDVKLPNSFEIN
ncbi:MAG: acylphosphatase [Gemmatimonadetes bacterium]|nr:MAG: acylphosphatase [Gemmatimonadota bacterium]